MILKPEKYITFLVIHDKLYYYTCSLTKLITKFLVNFACRLKICNPFFSLYLVQKVGVMVPGLNVAETMETGVNAKDLELF